MRPGEFELDMGGVMRVLDEPTAVAELERRTGGIVTEAQGTGPRGPHVGGHEIDLIAVGETHHTDQGAVVDVDWPSRVWHLIEFGSQNNPPFRVITRAAQNQGLRVIDRRHG